MAAGFKTATVNASDVAATLTDYPTYVDLSRLGITTLAEAQSVRVYADSAKTTEWAREIVSAEEMHVKVPSMTTTTEMYVDWDGSRSDYGVTDTYGRNAVWTGYKAVFHLEDVNDNSGNSETLTNKGTVTFSSAKIGTGAIYGSSNSTKFLSRSSDIGGIGATGSFSWSTWIYMQTPPSSGNYSSFVFKRVVGGSGSLDRIGYAYTGGTYYLRFYRLGSAFNPIDYTVTLPTNTWMLFHYTYDGSNIKAYYNGVQVGSTVASTGTSNITGTTGFALSGENVSIAVDVLKGNQDETRVTSSSLSADWITTEYNNQSDEATFWGTWSDVGGGGAVFTPRVAMIT